MKDAGTFQVGQTTPWVVDETEGRTRTFIYVKFGSPFDSIPNVTIMQPSRLWDGVEGMEDPAVLEWDRRGFFVKISILGTTAPSLNISIPWQASV